jgi:Flp pilus assembly pilin Flp
MINLYCKLKALGAIRDQGITAVEYALILFTVIGVIGAVLWGFSGVLTQVFQQTCADLGGGC